MPVRLTVILPTFNRASSLSRAIAALLKQTADPGLYEVVVVDNNSTDETRSVLASIAKRPVRAIGESRQGLSFARNAGLAAARGDLIAFTDDDVEVAPDWVSTIINSLEAETGIDGIGGRVVPEWTTPPPAWLNRDHWAPLALQDHGDEPLLFDATRAIGLVGANVAFRREVFDRLGGFAEHVQRVKDSVGSTEDHEFLSRLYEAGGRMQYVPRLLVTARVQPERYARAYHRRWHQGHGRFHALMRQPEMERSRAQLLGVPAHLLKAAIGDVVDLAGCALARNREAAFRTELRLRFFWGFATARVLRESERAAPQVGKSAEGGEKHVTSESPVPVASATSPAPDVSVVIPCYNHAEFLADAIRSVWPGTRRVEIIVVDDGSVDASGEVARAFPHVRYVRQTNLGLAAARNRGLREARGRFIVFLDADDRLLSGAIETGAATLERHPFAAMVFGRCVMIAHDGSPLPTPEQPRIETEHYAELLSHNPIWMPGMAMFRRRDIDDAGGFAHGFDAAADYDLYLRIAAVHEVQDHGTLVAAYRRHDGNMSGNATAMLRDTHAVMCRHRPHDPRLIDSWRDGRRLWRAFYGTHLVEEIRAHLHNREVPSALTKILTLVRWNPALAVRELTRKTAITVTEGARYLATRRPGRALARLDQKS